MGKEVVQGIFGGLFMIVTVVMIGSYVGCALSHGPEVAEPAAAEQPAAEQPAAE